MSKQVTSLIFDTHMYLSRIAMLLACVCAVSVLLYGILLLEAVAHTASQTISQRHIGQIGAQLSNLEAQYLSYSQNLTKDKAVELGFVMPKPDAVTSVFATVAASALSLRGQQ